MPWLIYSCMCLWCVQVIMYALSCIFRVYLFNISLFERPISVFEKKKLAASLSESNTENSTVIEPVGCLRLKVIHTAWTTLNRISKLGAFTCTFLYYVSLGRPIRSSDVGEVDKCNA